MAVSEQQPRKFYLFTHPRTASNLLVTMLGVEDQPSLTSEKRRGGGYFFLPTLQLQFLGPKLNGKPLDKWTEQERAELKQLHHSCFESLQSYTDAASAKGKDIFVKEHVVMMTEPVAVSTLVFGNGSTDETPWTAGTGSSKTHTPSNNTVLPDEFLKQWLPTFLIRHPALVISSMFRTFVDNENLEDAVKDANVMYPHMTLHWTRTLYDWYLENRPVAQIGDESQSVWPIILDADDIMLRPKIVLKYSQLLGFDESKLKTSWEPMREEILAQMPARERRFLTTIAPSTGIVKGKTAVGLDINEEIAKWKVEFGEEGGAMVEKWVHDAMPDYEYMMAKRLTA